MKVKLQNKYETIYFIDIFAFCDPKNKNTDEENLRLYSLIIATNPSFFANSTTNSQNRVPATSCSIEKSTPIQLTQNVSVSNTIKNKDLCYFSFIPATTSNYTITLTPSSNTDNLASNSDLAANLSTSVGGNKPTNFWTGTGAGCTNFGWENCVHNDGITQESITYVIVAGAQIAIGIYGFDCSALDGCKFSLRVN